MSHSGSTPICIQSQQVTEDAINTDLHTVLNHVDAVAVDFSSAFNTVVPRRMVTKLLDLGVSDYIYIWIKDFLTN